MKHNLLTLAIILIISSSCAKKSKEYGSIYDMFSKERSISADEKQIVIEPISFASYGQIFNSHLFVAVYCNNNSFNRVIDINSGKTVQNLLPYGRGRNESINSYPLGMNHDEIAFYTEENNSIVKTQFNEIFKPTPDQKWSRHKFDWSGELFSSKMSCSVLADNRYIATGCRKEGLFDIIDSDGNILYTFGEYKELEGDKIEKNAPYSGKFYVTPSQQRLLFSTKGGNIYYFYDISDSSSQPKLLNKYHIDTPSIIVKYFDGGGVSTQTDRDNTISGSISITASDEYFYLLHSNKKYADVDCSISDVILVFNRNGEPVEKLILDMKISKIYYNQDDNSLYTITLNAQDENCLMRFKL